MKTPERILTEHTLGEITFDTGLPGTRYTVFTRDGFDGLSYYIKVLAYDNGDGSGPVSSEFAHIDLTEEFRRLKFAMEQLKWSGYQKRDWLDAFCKPENLSHYESVVEVGTALRWFYIRAVQSALNKCAFPGPSDWLAQSKVAAAREIAEFEELVK